MKLRIRAGELLLLEMPVLALFRVETYRGDGALRRDLYNLRRPLSVDRLRVELELEPADEILEAAALDVPHVKPRSTLRRQLVAEIPARGPFDELDD